MNKVMRFFVGMLALAMSTPAGARDVNETLPAAADGHVDIVNISGSIEVYGWSRDAVEVTGELGDNVEELIFERDGDKVLVKVKVPRKSSSNISSDLVIRVPENSSIDVSAVSADITVEKVDGEQHLNSVSGDVVTAARNDVSAQSVSGDVDVSGTGDAFDVSANTVSGDVTLDNVAGSLVAEAVSGDVDVNGGSFERVGINSVNGDITFVAALNDGAKMEVETVNGEVEVMFSGDVSAKFEIETFNGEIDNCFGPDPERTSKYTPGYELSFTEGGGDGRVDIQTLNGDIEICK